jgi:hypothetical protein
VEDPGVDCVDFVDVDLISYVFKFLRKYGLFLLYLFSIIFSSIPPKATGMSLCQQREYPGRINIPLHGMIDIPVFIRPIIATNLVRRLTRIKQRACRA